MNYLIRMIAMHTARWIERGNLGSAAVGAALGLLMGGLLGWAAWRSVWLDVPGAASMLVGALIGAFVGAGAGSRVSASRQAALSPAAPPRPLYVSNANQALALPGLVLIVASIFAVPIAVGAREDRQNYLIAAAIGVSGLVLSVALAAYPILWIEVRRNLIVHRLFSSREYERSKIARWGFETSRGRYSQVPPANDPSPFTIHFTDGTFFQAVVSPEKGKDLAAAMER